MKKLISILALLTLVSCGSGGGGGGSASSCSFQETTAAEVATILSGNNFSCGSSASIASSSVGTGFYTQGELPLSNGFYVQVLEDTNGNEVGHLGLNFNNGKLKIISRLSVGGNDVSAITGKVLFTDITELEDNTLTTVAEIVLNDNEGNPIAIQIEDTFTVSEDGNSFTTDLIPGTFTKQTEPLFPDATPEGLPLTITDGTSGVSVIENVDNVLITSGAEALVNSCGEGLAWDNASGECLTEEEEEEVNEERQEAVDIFTGLLPLAEATDANEDTQMRLSLSDESWTDLSYTEWGANANLENNTALFEFLGFVCERNSDDDGNNCIYTKEDGTTADVESWAVIDIALPLPTYLQFVSPYTGHIIDTLYVQTESDYITSFRFVGSDYTDQRDYDMNAEDIDTGFGHIISVLVDLAEGNLPEGGDYEASWVHAQ